VVVCAGVGIVVRAGTQRLRCATQAGVCHPGPSVARKSSKQCKKGNCWVTHNGAARSRGCRVARPVVRCRGPSDLNLVATSAMELRLMWMVVALLLCTAEGGTSWPPCAPGERSGHCNNCMLHGHCTTAGHW
jgi:hypothetical protein